VYKLDNDPKLIAPLVDRVRSVLLELKLCNRSQQMHVGIALEEALLNALYHGNLQLPGDHWQADRITLRKGRLTDFVKKRREEDPFQSRTVLADISISRDQICFRIQDDGDGFDVAAVPEPGDPATLQDHVGRGLVLMENFVDNVSFNEKGNEVTMVITPNSEHCSTG